MATDLTFISEETPGEAKEEGERESLEEEGKTKDDLRYEHISDSIFSSLIEGKNVFLSGSGGTGKSHLIKELYTRLIGQGLIVYKTGSTGVASVNISGMTLHSWAGIQLGDKDANTYCITIQGRNRKALVRWKNTNILIIDEISMVGGKLFGMLSELGSLMRKNNKPFGGITLLICGDVCQLPPVKDIYFFNHICYDKYNFQVYILDKPWRFQKDLEFFHLLSRVRLGNMTSEDLNVLKTRQDAYYREKKSLDSIEGNNIRPTRIYSKKIDVHQMNMAELDLLPGDEIGYQASDTIQKKYKDSPVTIENYQDLMNKNVPFEVSLKKGAQVMLTWNLDVSEGLCNGSRGVVLECLDEAVLVKFKNQEVLVTGNVWTIEDEDCVFSRCQIPLILAWAHTIHKVQSATLDSAVVDLGTSLFSHNMGYVALSRCRSLDGIYIINIIPEKITCDPEAKEFEKCLRENAIEL